MSPPRAAWGLLAASLLFACDAEEAHRCDGADEAHLGTLTQKVIDCAEREDTGYVRGDPFPISVVTVDGRPAERETANAYWVMQQAAARDGVQIRIVSGFRTQAEQQRLYSCYVNCNCNNCNLAARPGFSNHQSGHALDLNTSNGAVLNWLNRNGARFGFSRTVPSEPWHWEWWGGGPGGGPCTGEPCHVIEEDTETLDDEGPCLQLRGPEAFWRSADDQGVGGGLRWTNAFQSGEPSNWARWHLHFDRAGVYLVEVSTGQLGIYADTRYRIRHDGETSRVRLDQSLPEVWQALGTFRFAAGGSQRVDVLDHADHAVEEDQHIVADAVRVTRQPCADLPPEGGLRDERGACFRAYGPEESWRRVDGEGHDGHLLWTNAFQGAEAANWARWRLRFEQGGDYEVEVRTGGAFGVFDSTRYRVRHDGAESPVLVDQSLPAAWQSLGIFAFAPGGSQSVDVFDNHEGAVAPEQHVVVDAVRVTPVGQEPEPEPEPNPEPEPEPETDAATETEPDAGAPEVDAGATPPPVVATPATPRSDAGLPELDPPPAPQGAPDGGVAGPASLTGGCASTGAPPGPGAPVTPLLILLASALRRRRPRP